VALAYIAAFATALGYGTGAVLQDRAAKRVPLSVGNEASGVLKVTTSRIYVLGMMLGVVAFFCSLVALRSLPLFAVQAISASSIGVAVLITWATTHHRPTHLQGWLLTILAIALVGLAYTAAPGDTQRVSRIFVVLVWISVVAVTLLALWASLRHTPRSSAVLGVISGLADGGMVLCVRAVHNRSHSLIHLLTKPLVIAIVPFAVVGVAAFAAALQRGSASIALACQQAVATLAPSLIGLAILGDKSRRGFSVLTYSCFAVTVIAAIALTLVHPTTPAEVIPEPAALSGLGQETRG
jgi:drug/metabolite transporter (DMT)-like permease